MNARGLVRLVGLGVAVAALIAILGGSDANAQQRGNHPPVAAPSHQVVACYFHRTVRCPTCKRISAYIGEAVQTAFARELKDGSVKMVMVDFQDPKNQAYTKAYKITGPTLVLLDVHGGKLTAWKPLPKVWSLVGKKDAFLKYVEDEVRGYLDGDRVGLKLPGLTQ